MRHITFLAIYLFLSSICFAQSTWYVPDDYPTIQGAISDVSVLKGDTVIVRSGTYVENIDFMAKAITLKSELGSNATVVDGNQAGSVVSFVSGEDSDSILDGFTITNGYANEGGGIYCSQSSPSIMNCTVSNNSAVTGGGSHNRLDSNPIVTHCAFTANSAEGGGGMYSWQSNPFISECSLSHNTADLGGGMYNRKCSPTITQCSFYSNTAQDKGGGMHGLSSNPTVTGCTFHSNSADFGGGLYNQNSGPAISDCTFLANIAYKDGGGTYNYSNNPIITNCTFTQNEALYRCGGGIYNKFSSPVVADCIFRENQAQIGGGMYNYPSSDPMITRCLFSKNFASHSGGGMINDGSGPTVISCIFSNNETNHEGGGMANVLEYPKVINCTFYGNTAGDNGGGISNWGGNLTATHCTFYGNEATNGGGIYSYTDSIATVSNSIFWNNAARAGDEVWLGFSFGPSTLNISNSVVDGGQSGVHLYPGCTLNWGGGMLEEDPLFIDVRNQDFHLSFASPCKDAGNNQTSFELDFEGDPRLAYGITDMGADEFYTHLYYTGSPTPGESIDLKIVDTPGKFPLFLWIGTSVLDTPIHTLYGNWFLLPPAVFIPLRGGIPSPHGLYSLTETIPLNFPCPCDIHIQAFVESQLTNLCTLNIQ